VHCGFSLWSLGFIAVAYGEAEQPGKEHVAEQSYSPHGSQEAELESKRKGLNGKKVYPSRPCPQ
jgi:hypothetical protein